MLCLQNTKIHDINPTTAAVSSKFTRNFLRLIIIFFYDPSMHEIDFTFSRPILDIIIDITFKI